jgi:type I restriction enzyme S subunit
MVKLTDVCRPKQWKTISSKNLTSDGYPVYGANGKIGFYSSFTHIKPTVLITCRGATCGTINICEPMSYVNGNAMALDELSSDVNINYLSYFLSFRGLEDVISGSAQPQITRIGLKNLKIPLPPLPTQTRIARALDLADRHRRLLREELDAYDRLGESLFLEMFGDPDKNPNQYQVFKLQEVTNKITDGTHHTPKYTDSGIPFLRVTDVTKSNPSKKFISEEEHLQLIKRCNPEKGDILYTKNGTIGIAETISWDYDFSIFVSLCLIKLKNELVQSCYLCHLLNTPFALRQAMSHSKTGTITNLHLVEIKRIKLPIPPLSIQTEFAKRIKQINLLKAKTQTTLKEADDLFNALLQRAFRGELFVE